MSCKKGTKSTQLLTKEQITELKQLLKNKTVLSKKEVKKFTEKYDISWITLKRRAQTSKIKVLRGYSWDEFLVEDKLVGKRMISFCCKVCDIRVEMLVVKFMIRKQQKQVCTKHYFKNYVFTKQWRANNRIAQLIAQNRKEVKDKHRKNAINMWKIESIRKSICTKLYLYWQQPGIKEKASNLSKKNWQNIEYRKKVFSNLCGLYDNINYFSITEFAFILWQQNLNNKIKLYDGCGIQYTYLEIKHNYYPDYIVNNRYIVEVKGEYWFYRFKEQVMTKSFAAIKFCKENNLYFQFILSNNIPKKFYKKAKKLHEIKIKKIQTL